MHSPANIAAALTFITAVLTFITAVLIFITAVLAAATTATAALLWLANILRVFGHLGREAGDIFQALGQYVVDTDQCSADIVKVFVADDIGRRMDRTVFIDRRAAAQCREAAAQLTDVELICVDLNPVLIAQDPRSGKGRVARAICITVRFQSKLR